MKTRFRILQCLRAPVGGLFRHVCDLAREQRARGHAVAVVCSDDGNALTAEKLAKLEPHLELGLHRLSIRREVGISDLLATRSVTALARQLRLDVLHGHGAKGGAYARIAASMVGGAHCFYTPHGGSLHYGPGTLKGRVVMLAERRMARLTDGLIFESAYSAGRYEAHIGPTACARRVIPNGILEDELVPVTHDADATKLLFIGELRMLKGVDVLSRAMAALRRHPRTAAVRLTVVGDGPDAATFHALSAELGLTEAVRFAGALPTRHAFTRGHLLVVPSRAESFPYIVLEAGAALVPMLASDVGGIPEIVEGTGNALLPPGVDAALAAAIAAALEDPGTRTERALRLQKRIREQFTVATMADAVLAFYSDTHSLRAAA